MTRKDYILIAKVIKTFRGKLENEIVESGDFNAILFLIDEFCYELEKGNKNFNESKFRQYVLGITKVGR
jgi:hypothetical protein